jgi:hypothetical protein
MLPRVVGDICTCRAEAKRGEPGPCAVPGWAGGSEGREDISTIYAIVNGSTYSDGWTLSCETRVCSRSGAELTGVKCSQLC